MQCVKPLKKLSLNRFQDTDKEKQLEENVIIAYYLHYCQIIYIYHKTSIFLQFPNSAKCVYPSNRPSYYNLPESVLLKKLVAIS